MASHLEMAKSNDLPDLEKRLFFRWGDEVRNLTLRRRLAGVLFGINWAAITILAYSIGRNGEPFEPADILVMRQADRRADIFKCEPSALWGVA